MKISRLTNKECYTNYENMRFCDLATEADESETRWSGIKEFSTIEDSEIQGFKFRRAKWKM